VNGFAAPGGEDAAISRGIAPRKRSNVLANLLSHSARIE